MTIGFAGAPPGKQQQKTTPVHLVNALPGPTGVFQNPGRRSNAPSALPTNSAINVVSDYAGINFNQSGGFVPPDTCGAAGPSNYIETVNEEIAIYNPKASPTTVTMDALEHFFFTIGGLSHVSMGSALADPIIVYDELMGRFIVGNTDIDFTLHVSNFVIAVSKSSNPATLTTMDWNFYSISTTEAGYDADYPGNLGYNADALVFTFNMFSVAPGSNHVRITSVSAADLSAGVPQMSLNFFQNNLAGFSVRPTTMHGSMAGDPMWLVTEHGDTTSIDVIKMNSVLSNAAVFTFTNLAVNPYALVAPPLNPNGSVITFNIDSRILKAAESNGNIVATHNVSPVASITEDDIRWYVIDVSGGTPTVVQQGNVSAGNNTYLTYPGVDINSSGEIGMSYMRSGTDTSTDYMSMYVTGRAASDALGSMQPPVLVSAGTGVDNYSDFTGGRAGDLSGINIDPSDGSFWAANEYAVSSASSPNANWGTAIANFTICGPSSWATATPYPVTISRYAFAQTATHLYVFGGVSNGTRTAAVNRMDLSTGMWEPRAPIPFASEGPTCALMESTGKVYCAEGDTGNQFAVYDIASDSWTGPLASVPGEPNRYGAASGAFNGKVFVVGGSTSFGNDVQVYDVATNTWSAGTSLPSGFIFAGYKQVGQYLYLVGGFSGNPNSNNTTTYRLDMTSAPGVWNTGPTFTPARADFGLAYDPVTNKLYALGGDTNGGAFFDSTNSVDELSLASWPSGTWTPSPPNLNVPNRQANNGGFFGAGQIWSVGGINGATFQFLSEVQTRTDGCPQTTPVLAATINDTVTGTGLNQFDYGASGWFYYNGPTVTSAYQMDEHYAYTTGVVAHFRFHGNQVKIYTVKEPHGGKILYNLDNGVDQQTISNYAPTIMGNMLSYTSPIVDDADHDLVIQVVGMHEMASDANAITVDKAEVYAPPGTSQVLAATVNDNVTGNGPNQWDYGQSGWFYYNGANISSAYQGDEHYAFTTGVVAHFRFSGTQVKIYTVKEPHGGIIGYNLDGMGETTMSNYAPTIMGNMLSYTSPMVPDGIHDLVIRVTGMHEMASDSNAITVDKAEVFAPPPQTLTATINDNTTGTGDNQWDYGMSGWFYYNGANISSAYQGDEHYAFTTNVTGTFRFTGTQVKIYTVKESAGGNIGYKLDGNAEVILSNYSPTIMGNTLSFVSPVVANGPHTLVIRVVGTHQAGSSGNAITVDKAEVFGP